MCLHEIISTERKVEPVTGYKVFETNGSAFYPAFWMITGAQETYYTGETYYANTDIMIENKYSSGFHMFLSREPAEKLKKVLEAIVSSDCLTIKKVTATVITAVGIEGDERVVVTEDMTICA